MMTQKNAGVRPAFVSSGTDFSLWALHEFTD
jgi:hypothetical protein